MNTGLQDAANLGWKLALAPGSTAAGSLLDSYDTERRPEDEQVLALTHLLFWAESSSTRTAALLRGRLAPLGAPLVPHLLRRRRLVAEGARLLARLDAGYRRSALSVAGDPPRYGGPHPGDRLPDATVTSGGREVELHALTARPGVHLLLDRDAPEPAWGHALVHVHRLESRPGTGVLAVRPDGHVGCAAADASDVALTGWLRRVGLPPAARSTPAAPRGVPRSGSDAPPDEPFATATGPLRPEQSSTRRRVRVLDPSGPVRAVREEPS
jgi:hypothetical protein